MTIYFLQGAGASASTKCCDIVLCGVHYDQEFAVLDIGGISESKKKKKKKKKKIGIGADVHLLGADVFYQKSWILI